MADEFNDVTPNIGLNRTGMNEVLRENMDLIDQAITNVVPPVISVDGIEFSDGKYQTTAFITDLGTF